MPSFVGQTEDLFVSVRNYKKTIQILVTWILAGWTRRLTIQQKTLGIQNNFVATVGQQCSDIPGCLELS
jgi:hypothetical protein